MSRSFQSTLRIAARGRGASGLQSCCRGGDIAPVGEELLFLGRLVQRCGSQLVLRKQFLCARSLGERLGRCRHFVPVELVFVHRRPVQIVGRLLALRSFQPQLFDQLGGFCRAAHHRQMVALVVRNGAEQVEFAGVLQD